jgi:peptide-methionine (R)-S-oxide reductase
MMITRRLLLGGAAMAVAALAFTRLGMFDDPADAATYPVRFTPEEWRRRLTAGQYKVLREEATEAPFSSPLNDEHRAGTFGCAGCAQPLFSSRTKFDSGTGWPSFWKPLPKAVGTETDRSLGVARTEVHCARCGGHLGHVFEDGPPPTGLRYCMNGVAMKFVAREA